MLILLDLHKQISAYAGRQDLPQGHKKAIAHSMTMCIKGLKKRGFGKMEAKDLGTGHNDADLGQLSDDQSENASSEDEDEVMAGCCLEEIDNDLKM